MNLGICEMLYFQTEIKLSLVFEKNGKIMHGSAMNESVSFCANSIIQGRKCIVPPL